MARRPAGGSSNTPAPMPPMASAEQIGQPTAASYPTGDVRVNAATSRSQVPGAMAMQLPRDPAFNSRVESREGIPMPSPAPTPQAPQAPVQAAAPPRPAPRPARRPMGSSADDLNQRELDRITAAKADPMSGYARGGVVKGMANSSGSRRSMPKWCK